VSDTPFKRTHCPNCHSENDLVLRNKMWQCGVQFSDSGWRTKDCYKRELAAVTKERDKALSEVVRLKSGGCARDQRTTQFCAEAVALQGRVERLEEAGDEIIWAFCPASVSMMTERESDALKLWNKAKEDKP